MLLPAFVQAIWSPCPTVIVLGTKAKSTIVTAKLAPAALGAATVTAMMMSAVRADTTSARTNLV